MDITQHNSNSKLKFSSTTVLLIILEFVSNSIRILNKNCPLVYGIKNNRILLKNITSVSNEKGPFEVTPALSND